MTLNRVLSTAILLVASLASAAAQTAIAAAAAKDGGMLTIPKEATKNANGTYSFTDKDGKKWIYRTGQFGVSRVEDNDESAALPKGVPAGATRNADGTFSFTDKDGARWTYSTTMFGISKTPARDTVNARSGNEAQGNIRVIDKGEVVRFERSGPFGISAWEKKKTDLTSEERSLFDARQIDNNKVDAKHAGEGKANQE